MTTDEAKDALVQLTGIQLTQFSVGHSGTYYGMGFYCDALDGVVYIVANSEAYHAKGTPLRPIPEEEEIRRWDIGEWEHPGGLFPSNSPEQQHFDQEWRSVWSALGGVSQSTLEQICFEALHKLLNGSEFRQLGVKGVVVLGPEDSDKDILRKRVMIREAGLKPS